MAFNPKILGQYNATTSTYALYTVPSATTTVVSTLAVANTTTSTATATVWICKAGASTSSTNVLLSSVPVSGNNTTFFTLGLTLAATDVINVTSGTASALTFHAYGSELA